MEKDQWIVSSNQGFPILCTLRAYGAHKGESVAAFAGEACKSSNTLPNMAGFAGPHAGKREHGKALL